MTTPVKVAIGVGGGAVALLLLAIVLTSFVLPAISRDQVPEGGAVAAAGTETAAPASESALSNVGNFVSALVTGKPRTYATPQAVFDAYWRAHDNSDIKALFSTIAPDQQEMFVAQVIQRLIVARMVDATITDGMEKYGVDFEQINLSTEQRELRRIASTVDDPVGFLKAADEKLTKAAQKMAEANRKQLMEALEARRAREAAASPGRPPRRELTAEERERMERMRQELAKPPRLKDLVIEGDRAKGTCVRGGDEFNVSSPISFVKVGDAWYVSAVGM
jgi:hypothetical protein